MAARAGCGQAAGGQGRGGAPSLSTRNSAKKLKIFLIFSSVRDPHVFGPPGSGSISQEVRIRILPFSHKLVEQAEIMIAKYNFNTKF